MGNPVQSEEELTIGTRAWVGQIMESTFDACRALRGAGQAEYARRAENAFANFDRVAERLGSPHTPETVLMTYYEKHIDGIHSHIAGHTSQREPVEGRIHDAIVYLILLKGLIVRRREKDLVCDRAAGADLV